MWCYTGYRGCLQEECLHGHFLMGTQVLQYSVALVVTVASRQSLHCCAFECQQATYCLAMYSQLASKMLLRTTGPRLPHPFVHQARIDATNICLQDADASVYRVS